MYAIYLLRCEDSIKLTNFGVQIITKVTRTTMEVILEVPINLVVTNLKSPRLNPSLMEEV